MRKWKFIASTNEAYFWDEKPIPNQIYTEDEIESMFGNNWLNWDHHRVEKDWEEVDDNFKSPDDYYAGQKDVLSISGICAGVTFSISGDFVKCSQVLNYIFNLDTK